MEVVCCLFGVIGYIYIGWLFCNFLKWFSNQQYDDFTANDLFVMVLWPPTLLLMLGMTLPIAVWYGYVEMWKIAREKK